MIHVYIEATDTGEITRVVTDFVDTASYLTALRGARDQVDNDMNSTLAVEVGVVHPPTVTGK